MQTAQPQEYSNGAAAAADLKDDADSKMAAGKRKGAWTMHKAPRAKVSCQS